MNKFKILYGYSWFITPSGNVRDRNELYISELNNAGFNLEGFCLTVNPPGPCLTFKELDAKWKRGDKELMLMYERLEKALDGKDILINSNGINLHPRFIESLNVFTVFQCFDDPESSEFLSKPVAAAYDLCLVGNIAEVNTYRSWGVKAAEWTPLGLLSTSDNDPSLTYDSIINGQREIDLFMMMDRSYKWRVERLNALENAFPEAHFYGKGWKRGVLPSNVQLDYLRRAKIGPNIHNSTGPINFRTFQLPANGVMQICDNKSYLKEIYELNKEAVGFDSIGECIELCKYYLAHDEERRIIAANGWKRVVTDYNMISVFKRNLNIIEEHMPFYFTKINPIHIDTYRKKTRIKRLFYKLKLPLYFTFRAFGFVKRKLKRLILKNYCIPLILVFFLDTSV